MTYIASYTIEYKHAWKEPLIEQKHMHFHNQWPYNKAKKDITSPLSMHTNLLSL